MLDIMGKFLLKLMILESFPSDDDEAALNQTKAEENVNQQKRQG